MRSLFKVNNFISAQNFGCTPKKRKRSSPQISSISARNFLILPPNSGEYQNKKVFAAFWFYLSPKFRISCCQVVITSQKYEGARHVLPPSVSDPRGRCPSPLEIDISEQQLLEQVLLLKLGKSLLLSLSFFCLFIA